jgi:hypothetical protein
MVTNDGEAAVNFSGMLVSGDFAQTSTCGASLAALNSCTISVTFKPTAAGRRDGSLLLHNDATNSPQVVDLTGNGFRH